MRKSSILLYISIVCIAFLYAIPSFYPRVPAVEITSKSKKVGFGDGSGSISKIKKILSMYAVEATNIDVSNDKIKVGFNDYEDQIKIKAALTGVFNDDFMISATSITTAPKWLKEIGAKPINLGLDLQGGIFFLMEVDLDNSVARYVKSESSSFESVMRENKIKFLPNNIGKNNIISWRLINKEHQEKTIKLLSSKYREFIWDDVVKNGEYIVVGELSKEKKNLIHKYSVEQNMTTLRSRINELGVSEPAIYKQGKKHIVVQLPGVQNISIAKKIIGATANLEFRLESSATTPSYNKEPFSFKNNPSRTAQLEKQIILTGNNISYAKMSFDENSMPQVSITLDNFGGKKMTNITKNAVGRNMAVIYVESKMRSIKTKDSNNEIKIIKKPYTDNKIISLATIQSVLGNNFRITGLDVQEASELALLLRSGALSAPIYFVQEQIIGPSLGKENIASGKISLLIGFLLVAIFMAVYYRAFGVVANISLSINIVMLLAIMSAFGAALTLPGIAGVVLTVGMAVDANVLIFSRIKEELSSGSSLKLAVSKGFDRAIITIMDSNLTTLIIGIVLFIIGSGAVKGFAVTLSIGIITSVFSAIFISRMLIEIILRYKIKNTKICI